MMFVMFFLSICSIFIGYLSQEIFIGFGSIIWNYNILNDNLNIIDVEFVSPLIKNLPFICSLFTMIFVSFLLNMLDQFILYTNFQKFNKIENNSFYNKIIFNFISFSYHAGNFNTIYNFIFNKTTEKIYNYFIKTVDRGYLEYFGPHGFYKFILNAFLIYRSWSYVVLLLMILFTLVIFCLIIFCLIIWFFINVYLKFILMVYVGPLIIFLLTLLFFFE